MKPEEQKQEKDIYALIDYKGHFGFRHDSLAYRSGMDIELLSRFFKDKGFNLEILNFYKIDLRDSDIKNKIFIYTSQEDPEYYYKSYIEDVIYALEMTGALVIPSYKFLKANNNKVFMEFLRDIIGNQLIQNIRSNHFGTLEELKKSDFNFDKKVVIKKAAGATGKGVYSGSSKSEIIINAKKISSIPFSYDDIKDFIRPYIHKGYIRNSRYRRKFIIQNFIRDLKNDWKILIFGDKFFIEYRGVRDNDFRASGSHKFLLNDDIPVKIPEGIFNFAENVKDALETPHLSLDIGFINNEFFLFEFQSLHFSSYAQLMSTSYYEKKDNVFIRIDSTFPLEYLYVDSLISFIENKRYKIPL